MTELGIADEAGLNAVPRRTNLNRIIARPISAHDHERILGQSSHSGGAIGP
jgi:hypothetical protein